MLLLVAVDHARLVKGILVVRENNLVVKNFRLDRVLNEHINMKLLVWLFCLIAGRSLAGDRT